MRRSVLAVALLLSVSGAGVAQPRLRTIDVRLAAPILSRADSTTVARSVIDTLVADSTFRVVNHTRGRSPQSSTQGPADYTLEVEVLRQNGGRWAALRLIDNSKQSVVAGSKGPIRDSDRLDAKLSKEARSLTRVSLP